MASNILTGDRRWASSRKSGMTILGKVPKPVNLPSQRLENNGLDPNVEIVPKGTLTWGSRPSSATPNVWSSSTLLSPKTEGSTGSPSHHSGRPSSGGSGTRPSTAGSDRSQDPSLSTWVSNSRPSTASGILPPNQTPMAARPRSAETRPGSSQLSRFAENSAEPAVAWGSTRTADNLGVASSKTDEFSLSSGDFPTLGSEKKSESHSQRGHSSQGHSAAASGALRSNENMELPPNGDGFVDHGNASTLRTEGNSCAEGGAPLNMKCQNNLQQAQPCHSLKMTSYHFDSWHGPPVRPPDGIWYRGTMGGPYQPAGLPGSFPVDPFAYYPRPFPPNSEALPRPGAGPGNYPPTNGETYHPQVLPNSYMFPSHPVISASPGPYQTPVPYDGYYSYHQQQIPSTGMATRPNVYNQHSYHNGNVDSGEFHNSPGGDDSQMAREQMLSKITRVPHQGHYMVLLKQHDDLEDNYPQEKGLYESSTPTDFDVKPKPRGSSSKQKGEQPINSRKNEMQKLLKSATDHQAPSNLASDCEGQPSNAVITNFQEKPCGTSDGILKREPDTAIPVVHDKKHYPIMKKKAALMEKIEGLNNKIRSANGLNEVGQFPFRRERSKQPKVINEKPEHSAEVILSNAAPTENALTFTPASSTMAIPVPSEGSPLNAINNPKLSVESIVVPASSESQDIGLVMPDHLKPDEVAYSHVPKRIHITGSRDDSQAKLRSDTQFDIRCARESSARDSSFVPEKAAADGPVTGILDNHHSKEAILTSSLDSVDHKAQRAKLKEMAIQRAKQLQKEEEERTREQRAKALAKLEELNRRSAAQTMKQKLNDALSPSNNVQHKEDYGVNTASQTNAVTSHPPGDILVGNAETFLWASDSENKKHETPGALPLNSASSTLRTVSQDSAVLHVSSLPLGHETSTTSVTTQNISSESHVSSGSKHKQMGYRRRQKAPLDKNLGERPIIMENVSPKYLGEVVHARSPDEKPATPEHKVSPENPVEVIMPASSHDKLLLNGDPSLQHRKKNSRNSRNKNKDEALMGSSLPSSAHSHENIEEHPCESSKSHSPASVTETLSVPAQVSAGNSESQDFRDHVVHSHQGGSKIIEETHGKMSNQWKPQPPRRSARNQQVIRHMDKVHGSETVIWAPIKPANKIEQSEEISQGSIIESNCQSSQRNEQDMPCGMRTKRAEMERYIPKPVAKELLQQENPRKSSSYVNQSSDMPEKPYLDSKGAGMGKFDDSSVGRTDIIADTKNGEDNKPSKRGRAHASWRQRSSSESTLPLQSSNESLNSSDASKIFNKPSDQHLQLPEQLESDGLESSRNPVPKELSVLVVIKDQGVTSRQRRQQVHRVAGSNYVTPVHHHLQSGMDDKSGVDSSILGLNDTDARNSVKDDNKNTGGEHIRTHSHWKPKSQSYSHNQKQGSRGNGGQRISSHDGRSEKFTYPGFETNPLCDETKSALTKKDGSNMVTDAGHQDTMGTRMGACSSDLSKEQMHIPHQDVPTNTDLLLGNIHAPHENQVSPHQHRHHNGRLNRGQEATYRSSRDLVQNSGKSNVQINGDKRKNNSHFEYQPIGSFNKSSDLCQSNSNTDQEAQSHHPSRQRYKERVQTQTRNRGHFVRQNSGATAHVDDSYNNRE